MAKPSVYLTNSRKHYCTLCKCDLVPLETELNMSKIGGSAVLKVRDVILYCPSCQHYYVTQQMCRSLVEKHPGYYLSASLIKAKKNGAEKNKNKPDSQRTTNQPNPNGSPLNVSQNSRSVVSSKEKDVGSSNLEPNNPTGINSPVLLSNTAPVANNTCPLCRSVLGGESVNIPVIDENNNFVRYYLATVPYCYRCRKAFLSKEKATEILSRINANRGDCRTIRINNATVQPYQRNQGYLFRPTLNNSEAVFSLNNDYRVRSSANSGTLELNEKSFLGEMGYSVSENTTVRRIILDEAVKQFGKRRVCDHLAFLISTRRAQADGINKYSNALRIWQSDLNYISEST